MSFLPDTVIDRLASELDTPDLGATKYRLGPILGRGGMGIVYAADDPTLSREVAIKVSLDRDDDGVLAEHLRQEARVLAGLEHSAIVPVHDFGELPDGRLFYVMKRVRGERLDDHLRDLGFGPRMRIFQRLAEALAFAHEHGVVHRDLKPSNVMVGTFGEVWVMDWGLAVRVGTLASGGVGTIPFAAPEQVEDAAADVRADVYSLGVLLQMLLTDDSPRAARSIATRAASARPADRYRTAAELAEDVARLLDGEVVRAHRESPFERVARFGRKNAVVLSLFAIYLFVRLLIAALR
jgi:eukaryotic-like serine/threonine-protein kinase